MLKYLKQSKAQIIGEYVVTIAILVGAMVTMTVYIRRALQARVHDAAVFMVETADEASRNNGGPGVRSEYEPYYGETDSTTTRDLNEHVELLPGGATGIFRKDFNQVIQSQAQSLQLPPREAD